MEGHTQKIKVAARQHIHFVSVGAEMFSPGVVSLATSILLSTTGFVLAQDDPYPACYQFFTTWPQASSVNVLITWSKLWLTSFILDHKTKYSRTSTLFPPNNLGLTYHLLPGLLGNPLWHRLRPVLSTSLRSNRGLCRLLVAFWLRPVWREHLSAFLRFFFSHFHFHLSSSPC